MGKAEAAAGVGEQADEPAEKQAHQHDPDIFREHVLERGSPAGEKAGRAVEQKRSGERTKYHEFDTAPGENSAHDDAEGDDTGAKSEVKGHAGLLSGRQCDASAAPVSAVNCAAHGAYPARISQGAYSEVEYTPLYTNDNPDYDGFTLCQAFAAAQARVSASASSMRLITSFMS